ncbi:MAG TPA: aspartate kinase, partial [Hymenobacter sp.]|uniref:aspartate kinase n=1 Tax=Hymenobacter sp. TaxID=1898978 RepID=UPI002D7FB0D2
MEKEQTGLQVYKFGGASVKDAAAILNLCRIVRDFGPQGPLLIVVSAMGKTTNALEEIYDLAYHGRDYSAQLATVEAYHHQAGKDIGEALPHPYIDPDKPDVNLISFFEGLAYRLANLSPSKSYDEGYDQVVSYGETLSSYLVYYALTSSLEIEIYHRASMIVTDDTWREGKVDWQETEKRVKEEFEGLFAPFGGAHIIVTEGFTGQVLNNHRTTTLGREGSDYSAAIFAYCLRAESVTIWKDVPGLLNADPKIFPNTVRYPEISYQETIEMAYYGASVIHPKTLKPLADRQIPLRVKSFVDPAAEGTLIHDCQHPPLAPAFIRKTGQVLLSLESKDFAFISEENLEVIFGTLAQARLKINVMQNSALSFSVCLDGEPTRLAQAVAALRTQFKVQYNEGLTLFTIKNYTPGSVAQLLAGRTVLLEQRT